MALAKNKVKRKWRMLIEDTNSFQLDESGEFLRNNDRWQCTGLTMIDCICRWEKLMCFTQDKTCHIYNNKRWNPPLTAVLTLVDLSQVLHWWVLQAGVTDVLRTTAQGSSGPRGPSLLALHAYAAAKAAEEHSNIRRDSTDPACGSKRAANCMLKDRAGGHTESVWTSEVQLHTSGQIYLYMAERS